MKKDQSYEIDILVLLSRVWARKALLMRYLAAGLVTGIIIALNTPKEYASQTILAPEMSVGGSLGGDLGDLASMMGVKIGGGMSSVDAIYPKIYPDVLSSPDFLVRLFDVKVCTRQDTLPRTYLDHVKYDSQIPFWQRPKLALMRLIKQLKAKKQDRGQARRIPYELNEEEFELVQELRSLANCIIDKKTSVITLSFRDQDPRVAAIMVDTIQRRIQQYVTDYRTQKARNDYAYAQRMYDQARQQYDNARQAYARYADAHRDILLQSHITRRDELENEMQQYFNMQNQFLQQLNAARAKIQERTPAFTIIQSPAIPVKPVSLPRRYIVLGVMLVFALFHALWVLLLEPWWASRNGRKPVSEKIS